MSNYMNGDVITLQDGTSYVIVDVIDRFYDRFYYIVSVSEDKSTIGTVCKIIKIVGNEEVNYIKVVDEKEELVKIVSLFLSRYA